jgi:hypothetical protein
MFIYNLKNLIRLIVAILVGFGSNYLIAIYFLNSDDNILMWSFFGKLIYLFISLIDVSFFFEKL